MPKKHTKECFSGPVGKEIGTMFTRRMWIVFSLVAVLAFGLAASTTDSLAAGSPTNPIITGGHCTVTIEFDAAALVPYQVVILDDNVVIFDETAQPAAVGETLIFVYTGTEVGTAAPGIGIYIYENGTSVFDVDPYTGIDGNCQQASCEASLPSGSVVVFFLSSTMSYWAPRLDATTGVILDLTSGSKSYWVLGQDESHSFYKIALACDYLWVPVEAMGPNYDAVWNGTPLPSRVVQ
jgi:hypothetical protein